MCFLGINCDIDPEVSYLSELHAELNSNVILAFSVLNIFPVRDSGLSEVYISSICLCNLQAG